MATGLKFQGRRLGHCRERKSLPAPRNTTSTLEVGCSNSFCLFLGLGGVNSLAGLTFPFLPFGAAVMREKVGERVGE